MKSKEAVDLYRLYRSMNPSGTPARFVRIVNPPKCEGTGCGQPIDDGSRYCVSCGTLNKQFDEAVFMEQEDESISDFQARTCGTAGHREGAQLEKELPGSPYCEICGFDLRTLL